MAEYYARVSGDPEAQRVDELLARVTRGEVSEAEREELAIYVADDPELADAIRGQEAKARLGGEWLARVSADEELARVETSTRTNVERGVGLALFFGGLVVSFAAPVIGLAALMAGLLLLVFSFLRVRLRTHRSDPYKDIQR